MILIIGGAGYIGSHVNKILNLKSYKTIVFDNLVRGNRNLVKWGEFVLGDLGNKADIRRCFETYPITAAMHFGAFAYVGESVRHPLKYYINNVINTLNLLDVMVEFKVRYLIFSSSCTTYGLPSKVPIPEDHPQSPINPYGKSKLMVEGILQDCDKAYGMKHMILRYFNAAGADPDREIGEIHEPETHLIPLVIQTALGIKDSIQIFGTDYPTKDGTCIRDYVHVMDIADAHVKALEHLMQTNESNSFNLGNGEGYSVKEIISSINKISKMNVNIITADRRPGDPPILISDSKKARDVLKWRPQYRLEKIIETAWEWHRGGQVK